MKNSRSDLLKSMPGKDRSQKLSTISRRLVFLVLLSVIIATPLVIIITEVLPKNGSGHVFYWLHDAVWLPLKGFTYTLYYPFSLGWWGPIATVLMFWGLSYIFMLPITREPHIYILRKVVRRNSKHRLLLLSTRLLRKWRLEAMLLTKITGLEREKALARLIKLPLDKIDDTLLDRAYYLTDLHINLLLSRKADFNDQLEAVYAWYRLYMHCRNRIQRTGGPTQKRLEQIAAMSDRVLPVLLNRQDRGLINIQKEKEPGFNLRSITLDLLYLSALHHDPTRRGLPGLDAFQDAAPEKTAELTAAILSDSCSARQAIIDASAAKVEKMCNGDISVVGFIASVKKEDWPLLLDNGLETRWAVRLAVAVAMDFAGLIAAPGPALGFIESQEVLNFHFQCLPDNAVESGLARTMQDFPNSTQFRWCADLATENLKAYEKAWNEGLRELDGPVSDDDFTLARTRIRALYHAAGPELELIEEYVN